MRKQREKRWKLLPPTQEEMPTCPQPICLTRLPRAPCQGGYCKPRCAVVVLLSSGYSWVGTGVVGDQLLLPSRPPSARFVAREAGPVHCPC